MKFLNRFFNSNKNKLSKIIKLEEKCDSLLLNIKNLEDENIDTNNMLYELSIDIDMLKIRIQTLENLVIGDGK
jgi:hypothetical protein